LNDYDAVTASAAHSLGSRRTVISITTASTNAATAANSKRITVTAKSPAAARQKPSVSSGMALITTAAAYKLSKAKRHKTVNACI
jgi:hypothetical protein